MRCSGLTDVGFEHHPLLYRPRLDEHRCSGTDECSQVGVSEWRAATQKYSKEVRRDFKLSK